MDSEEDSLDEQERDNLMIRMMQQNWSHLQESDSLPLINLPDDVIPTKDSAIDFSELPSFSKRYYVDVKDSLCIFCKQKGHEFKNCKATSIDCYICRKNHDISKCPLSVSCFKCGNLGHRISDCTASNDLYCSYCERETHHMHDCPWVWRQYVFKDDAVSDAHSYKISCYNCGQAHFGDV